MVAKLERVPLRDVGWHEAFDFTKWLEENIDAVNEVTDLNLSSAEREQSAGTFKVDVLAEDEDGKLVVIENQLGKSDHDHLGKLITYLTALDAKAAVWIVSNPRPEHVGAITWLNESSNAAFYLLKVEAVKIAGSDAAPLLTLIVGPSEESTGFGGKKKELAERHKIRLRFWTELLNRAKDKTKLHAAISPSQENWVTASAGKSGLAFTYIVRQHGATVGLYIDRGKDSEEENKAIFDELVLLRDEIKNDFGGGLVWERVEGKQTCSIKNNMEFGGYRDEEKWPELQEAMVDAMVRLEKALKPCITKLTI